MEIKYNRKIDIIIPAYNVPDKILYRCLASIACQEILDDLEVTIVDDASTEQNYSAVIENFIPYLKINLLRYEVNGGPGVARQYGIDHTYNEYIVFIDADDTFYSALALKMLRICIEEHKDNVMCTSLFEEIQEHDCAIDFVPHPNDLVWMFGKIYRREFIQINNIRFHPTSRANEDTGFNRLCQLYALSQEKCIADCRFPTYFWHFNPNSITRINNGEYTFGGGKQGSNYGYVENMIYVIETAWQNNLLKTVIDNFIIECISAIFVSYTDTLTYAPKYAEYNFALAKEFYDRIYTKLDLKNKDERLKQFNCGRFATNDQNVYTIDTFLEDLRKE